MNKSKLLIMSVVILTTLTTSACAPLFHISPGWHGGHGGGHGGGHHGGRGHGGGRGR
jgi:Spy/CpxP family protein refolding chaperone